MLHETLLKITAKTNLSRPEAEEAMEDILSGRATEAQIFALLSGLQAKTETLDEIVGFANAMRRHATPIFLPSQSTADQSSRRYLRHRRRWLRDIQRFHGRGIRGGGRRGSRGEARQPLD